jgi:ABC-2 type transport system permease protein/lipopolysaccharide transport system permease protein
VFADLREVVTELIVYRELLFRMVHRDLLIRYKQTIMGLGWAVFMPLVNTAIFSIVFTRVAPIDTGMPYPLYAFSGLIVWNAFSSALKFAVSSLTSNPNLVTKVYFPREIFPISALFVTSIDALVSGVLLAALMAYYHVAPTLFLLLLPVVLAVQVAFTAALALALSMANLFYRDVKYLFDAAITVWMFATSVVYPVEKIGGRLGEIVVLLNPMAPIIDAFRAVVIRGAAPDPRSFIPAAVFAVVALVAASVAFHRAEFKFAENI